MEKRKKTKVDLDYEEINKDGAKKAYFAEHTFTFLLEPPPFAEVFGFVSPRVFEWINDPTINLEKFSKKLASYLKNTDKKHKMVTNFFAGEQPYMELLRTHKTDRGKVHYLLLEAASDPGIKPKDFPEKMYEIAVMGDSCPETPDNSNLET